MRQIADIQSERDGIQLVALSITMSREAIIDVFEYAVEAADGKRVAVYNDFPALEVGHCVTLFTSPKPRCPRVSPVGRCPWAMIKHLSKAIGLPVAVGAGAFLAVVLPDSWRDRRPN